MLSGPAGGVVGYAMTSYDENDNIPVIGFDMGGLSNSPTSLTFSIYLVYLQNEAMILLIACRAKTKDLSPISRLSCSLSFILVGLRLQLRYPTRCK